MRARPYAAARAHDGSSGQVFRTVLEESRGGGGGGGVSYDGCMRPHENRNPPSSDIHCGRIQTPVRVDLQGSPTEYRSG